MRVAVTKKLLTLGTLVAFSFLVMFSEYSFGQTETPLARAQAFFSQGQYDEAVKVLDGYIAEIQANPEQKPNLAAANYLLAKVYFEVGDDAPCDEALLKVFSALPGFDRDEPNYGFKERVLKAKAQLAGKVPVAAETTAQPVSQQAKVEPTAAKTDSLPTKTDTKTVEQPIKTEPKIIEQQPKVKPQTIEKPKSGAAAVVKKKKKFPVLLAVLGVAALGVVLYFTVFKSSTPYDIRGRWKIEYSLWNGSNYWTMYWTFSGDKKQGTISLENGGSVGDYYVNGKNIKFNTGLGDWNGSFLDENNMWGDGYGGDGEIYI